MQNRHGKLCRDAFIDDSIRDPVFLIGFPRSGTTLLEMILDSHNAIQSIEEKPIVDNLCQELDKTEQGFPECLATLDCESILSLRKFYINQTKFYIDSEKDKIILDKYPLNIIKIPIISRVFPSAKILMVLRHPCDACLSCFMQSFEDNAAMNNFFSMEDTVNLYINVMKIWESCTESMDIDYQVIRYEDLTENFDQEVGKVLSFLNLDYQEAIAKYYENARNKKEAITTPSYHQVTQPIYGHARYRWKNYQKQFAPQFEKLSHYVELFGYRE